MSKTVRLSLIAVMLLSSTALGVIAYNAMQPPPLPPAPPPAPVVVQKEEPQPWVCPYDQVVGPKLALLDHINAPTEYPHVTMPTGRPASEEEVRRALGVIPCSLSRGDSGAKVEIGVRPFPCSPSPKNGHFYPKVAINDAPVCMMADTGATDVAFSELFQQIVPSNAKDCKHNTANGQTAAKCFVLPEITVQGFVLHNVEASCCMPGNGAALLGMSALERFAVTFNDGWMTLAPR
jgi:clan AA aspartic protease (TIGR02281 family)